MTFIDAEHDRHRILAQIVRNTARGSRATAEQMRAAVRVRAGIEVLTGVADVRASCDVRWYPKGTWIASGSQVDEAWVIDRSTDAWIEWHTEPVPDDPAPLVAFVWSMAVGRGSPFPSPTGQFDVWVNGSRMPSFMVARGARRWSGERGVMARWSLRTEAAERGGAVEIDSLLGRDSLFDDGYAVLLVDRELVTAGRPAVIRLAGSGFEPSTEWVRVATGPPALAADPHLTALTWATAPAERPVRGDRSLLLGDLHNHSRQSFLLDSLPPGEGAGDGCGQGDRDSLFRYARDIAGLDFFCLSEHDWQMDQRDWRHLTELVDSYDEPDRFIAVHGFEWTSAAYGHRNVYFRNTPAPLYHSADPTLPQNAVTADAPSPEDLWAFLRASGQRAMTVPHHMSSALFPLRLEHYYDAAFDRVAEIYSSWGDSLEHDPQLTIGAAREPGLAFIEAIRRGYHIGFIGSSDSHDGHPGNAQGTQRRPHLFHFLGSGLAAVWAKEPTREGVFDALAERRCYALTGGDLAIELHVNDQPMGSVVPAERLGRQPRLQLNASSAMGIRRVIVYRNGQRVETAAVSVPETLEFSWTDPHPHESGPVSYFVAVEDTTGERAWTSPILFHPEAPA